MDELPIIYQTIGIFTWDILLNISFLPKKIFGQTEKFMIYQNNFFSHINMPGSTFEYFFLKLREGGNLWICI